MSTGAQLDINIEKGSRFELTASFYDALGELLDLTGYTVYAQVRAMPATSAALWGTMAVSAVTSGTVQMTIDSNLTALFPDPINSPSRPFRPGHWDLFIAPTGAASATHAKRYLYGTAFVFPSGALNE